MTQAIRPSSIFCARCGAQKKVGRSGPVPTYCSAACRATLSYERSLEDGRYAQTLAASRQCNAERRASNARPCPYCSALMTNPRRVQCGAKPCRLRHAADWMRRWQRNYHAAHGAWYAGLNYPEQQRAYDRRRRAEKGHWRQLYPEQAATYDARRRALVEQARTADTFAPIDVHTRDEWTCKLCLQPIDAEIAWPDPKSPSMDHVIPLSRGGAHAMHNVQSAHLGCNSSKGDRDMADMVIRAGAQAATQ